MARKKRDNVAEITEGARDELKDLTYTLDEAVVILKVTRRTIYNYIKAGTLKAVKMDKYWRIPRPELERFIDRGTSSDDIGGE